MGNSKFNVSDAIRLFFPDFKGLKTWFKLSRVKLYTNDLRGKKYFELAWGSSYRGYNYSDGMTEIDFGSN